METNGNVIENTEGRRVLRQLYLERRGRNPSYSMRAFARDTGLSQTLLSLILSGKRALTLKQAKKIAALLDLAPDAQAQLLGACAGIDVSEPKGGSAEIRHLDIERFKAIGQWHHLAILDLTTTKGFRSDPAWIARRLRIPVIDARDSLERLLALGLLEEREGQLAKSERHIYFKSKESSAAIRQFHRQMIEKAGAALESVRPADFKRRDISGMTIAADERNLPKVRACIEKFQAEIAAILSEGECGEVFQLNVQLFPLTQKE